MKRLFIILLAVFMLVQNGLAQDRFTPESSDVKNRVNLKIMPLSLVHSMHHVRFGVNLIAGSFNFDFYAGIGLAKQYFEYSNVVNPRLKDFRYEYEVFEQYFQEQNRMVINFDLGLKIGYTILKR